MAGMAGAAGPSWIAGKYRFTAKEEAAFEDELRACFPHYR